MAWDEQRRMRTAKADDTLIMGDARAADDAQPDAGSVAHPRRGGPVRLATWGQQFGWIAALVLAVLALIFSVIAFANAGNAGPSRFGGRAGYLAPYGRTGGGFGGNGPGGFAPNAGPTH